VRVAISSQSELTPRAFRYSIYVPMRFREKGTTEWHEGKTVNISRTGVLFQSQMNLPPQSLLEMQITLPHELRGEPPASVRCWGPVVRSEPTIAAKGIIGLAASIRRYRFSHESATARDHRHLPKTST
jgi:hypothetical protein